MKKVELTVNILCLDIVLCPRAMKGLFPLKNDTILKPNRNACIVSLDEKQSSEVFEALASETTREILNAVYKSPKTASEIAEYTETSLQNAKYHLDKLLEADLILVADTWYSAQGNEMKVYTAKNQPLVIFAGDEHIKSIIDSLRTRLVGALGTLLIFGIAVNGIVESESQMTLVSQGQESSSSTIFNGVLSPGMFLFSGGMIIAFFIFVNLYWLRRV